MKLSRDPTKAKANSLEEMVSAKMKANITMIVTWDATGKVIDIETEDQELITKATAAGLR